jgi:hypothetical protein
MALAVGEYVARAGSEALVRAFCVDPGRPEPTPGTVFRHSYGNPDGTIITYMGKRYTPAQAAAAGIGEFVGGDGYSEVRFRPKVPGEVRINVRSDTVISEVDDPIPQPKLSIIRQVMASPPGRMPLGGGARQEALWDRTETVEKQVLLRDLGLYRGALDGLEGPAFRKAAGQFQELAAAPADLRELLDYSVRTQKPLSSDGALIFDGEMRTRLSDVGFRGQDAAAAFSRYHGLTSTRLSDAGFVQRLELDEATASELEPPSLFGHDRVDRTHLTVRDGPEAWVYHGSTLTARLRGKAAIDAAERQTATLIGAASRAAATYLYATPNAMKASSIEFVLGGRRVSESRAAVEALLNGSGSLPKLDAVVNELRGRDAEKPALLVYRDGVYGAHADSPEQQASFAAAYAGVGLEQINPSELAGALRARYADRLNVYLASDRGIAEQHMRRIPHVSGAADIAVLKGEKIQDWGAIENVAASLKKAGISLLEGSDVDFEAGNVVVLTGHRDRNLSAYLETLLDKGILEDKLVVLFSCYDAAAEASHSKLLQSPDGPRAVVYFPDQIQAGAVSLVIREMTLAVKSFGSSPVTLPDLLSESVERALAKAPPELKSEIAKLMRLIVQLSELAPPATRQWERAA